MAREAGISQARVQRLWAASAIKPRPGARDCDLARLWGGVASWGSFEATRRAALGALADEPRHFVGVDLVPDEIARWCGGSA